MRKRRSTSGWRLLLRLFGWLVVILLLPVLAWWLYNRFDEAPSEAALRYASPTPRSVDDAANAWLHLYGLGAPEGEAPHVFGRRRLDAWARRSGAEAQASTELPPELEEAFPAIEADFATHYIAELCPAALVDCIDWAGLPAHADALARLEEANALRLQRYEAMLELVDWHSLNPATPDSHLPSLATARLYRNLLASKLWGAFRSGDANALSDSLGRLARNAAFWRRVPAQAGDVFSIMAASAMIEGDQRLAGDALGRLAPSKSGDIDPAIERALDDILQPPPAPIAWREAMGHEYRTFVATMTPELPGTWATLWQCISGSTRQGCLQQLTMDAAFVPQASFNLHARNTEAMQRWLEADAADIDAAGATYSAAFDESMPNLESAAIILRQMSYNYVGRILVTVAVPRSDWALRIHDREALRRMLVIKHRALSESVPLRDMQKFLATQPRELRNPYTRAPFEWDPLFGELGFTPKAKVHWQRPSLTVALPRPPMPAGVAACTQAFEFELIDHFGADTPVAVHFGSCGLGYLPTRFHELEDEKQAAAADAVEARVYPLEARRAGNEVGLRLIEFPLGKARRHEVRMAFEDEPATHQLTRIGEEGVAYYAARLLGPARERWVSLRVNNQTAREVARAIAAATGVRVDGLARLADDDRAMVVGDYTAAIALSIAGDIGGRQLRKVDEGHFVFE